MKFLKIFLSISLLLFLLCIISFLLNLYFYAHKPLNADNTKKSLTISPGMSFRAVLDNLRKADLIDDPVKFILIARFKGYDNKIKAGEYLVSSSMTPLEILETLEKGKVRLYKLTIPEGYNIHQIAESVEKAGLGTKNGFIRAATDPDLVQKMGIDAETFEGYLFPETYFFPKNTTCEMIISAMVKRFWTEFSPPLRNRAKKLGLTNHEVVTLASIIEKETGAPFERPIISSVFHNRLKKGMRLESDPAVIYGISDFNGNITKKHIKTKTPYNTYIIRGLPPGPISNPGIKAIEAALYPADTDFLYFVSKKDDTHKFSTSIKEHNRAVIKYQLRRK